MTSIRRPIAESYWVIPGRLLAGEYPGSFDPDAAHRRLGAFLEEGFNTFIDLTQPGELLPYEPFLYEEARARLMNVEYARFPIRDRGLPAAQTMSEILNAVDAALLAGRKVYLHCWGGVGRTGMAVGCYLVRHGSTGEEALARLAQWWADSPKRLSYPRSPETDEQVQFIRSWSE